MADANVENYALVVGGDGSPDGSVNIFDRSPLQHALAISGDVKFSSAQQLFGKNTLAFDQVGDYISVPVNAAFSLIPGNFTVIARVFQTVQTGGGALFGGVSYQNIVGTNQFGVGPNSSFALYLGSGKPGFDVYQGGTNKSVNGASAVTASAWHELMGVRSGNTIYLFVDGTLIGTAATSAGASDATSRPVRIGADGAASGLFAGAIGEVLFLPGVALYTASYTVPTDFRVSSFLHASGTVRDSSGAAASRKVRAYRRDTGALVGQTVSDVAGNYAFPVAVASAEVTVLGLDNATTGTIYDDICERVIPA